MRLQPSVRKLNTRTTADRKKSLLLETCSEDLQRRDFTMNAIAMDKDGNLIDPFHGQESIKNKVIQTVGKAADRFQEDALRMMRAVRFVSQLSFRIEEETLNALDRFSALT